MPSAQTTNLLTNLQQSDIQTKSPSLYLILRQLILSADEAANDLLAIQSSIAAQGVDVNSTTVYGFTAAVTSRNIILSWTSLGPGYLYEIREGTVWETASYVTTAINNSVALDPVESGTYYYLIKSINDLGSYSLNSFPTSVNISLLGMITLSAAVEGNSVALSWNIPTSQFSLDRFDIYKNGVLISSSSGRSPYYFYNETAGGTFQYYVRAYDIAGNTITSSIQSVLVYDPANSLLITSYVDGGTGSKSHCIIDGSNLYAPVDDSETWAHRALTYASPQAQITAGFPYYLQPTLASGSYDQYVDLGSLYSNANVNVSWSQVTIVGVVTVNISLSYSIDNITWSTPVNSNTIHFASARYIHYVLTFTATDTTHDFCMIDKLQLNLTAYTVMDAGTVSSVSTDTNGTSVTYNKTFVGVISVTLTPNTTTAAYCTYNWINPADPTQGFRVKTFDGGGSRITATVSWKVRGTL